MRSPRSRRPSPIPTIGRSAPHLTLAHARTEARDLRQVVDALDAWGESDAWTVDEVVLFDSDRRTDGAVHTEHARFPLGAAS